jgi:hypothetical protein
VLAGVVVFAADALEADFARAVAFAAGPASAALARVQAGQVVG